MVSWFKSRSRSPSHSFTNSSNLALFGVLNVATHRLKEGELNEDGECIVGGAIAFTCDSDELVAGGGGVGFDFGGIGLMVGGKLVVDGEVDGNEKFLNGLL